MALKCTRHTVRNLYILRLPVFYCINFCVDLVTVYTSPPSFGVVHCMASIATREQL